MVEAILYETGSFRLIDGTDEALKRLLAKYPHKWANKSMIVRAAVARILRENGEAIR